MNRGEWLVNEGYGECFTDSVLNADVLILPRKYSNEGGENVELLFEGMTVDLFRLLEESDAGLVVDHPVDDNDYKEVREHSLVLVVGTFLVTAIAAPVVSNLISKWAEKKIFSSDGDSVVRCEFIVEYPDGRRIRAQYDGPGEEFTNFCERLGDFSEQPVDNEERVVFDFDESAYDFGAQEDSVGEKGHKKDD